MADAPPSRPSSSRAKRSTRPPKTALLVAQRIVNEIADQGLPTNAPLMSEKQMLDEYGVARGTLREALRYLEMQSVVAMKIGPGGGPVVGERSARPMANTLALMSHLNRTPFRDVLEARVVLEPALAVRAADRATEAQLDAIDESVERVQAGADDLTDFLDENERFHDLIAAAANNAVLEGFIGSLHWIVDATPLGADYTVPERKAVARAHGRIADRLRARDGAGAGAAMLAHVEEFAAYLENRHPEILNAPLRWDQMRW